MESTKYIGVDVHKDTISVAVMNSAGKVVMESILETKAITSPGRARASASPYTAVPVRGQPFTATSRSPSFRPASLASPLRKCTETPSGPTSG